MCGIAFCSCTHRINDGREAWALDCSLKTRVDKEMWNGARLKRSMRRQKETSRIQNVKRRKRREMERAAWLSTCCRATTPPPSHHLFSRFFPPYFPPPLSPPSAPPNPHILPPLTLPHWLWHLLLSRPFYSPAAQFCCSAELGFTLQEGRSCLHLLSGDGRGGAEEWRTYG